MPSIQTSPHPLVFKTQHATALGIASPNPAPIAIRTIARALDGMQKEALVSYGQDGAAWRMVCDEGPYLNGTDLAPFPLAFFTAGLAFSTLSEILALAKQRGIVLRDIEFTQENRYGMEGSALAGTMTGSALPVELAVRIDADADAAALNDLIVAAVAASPANGLLRELLTSEFSLTVNGRRVSTGRVAAYADDAPADPAADAATVFDTASPLQQGYVSDIIQKLESAQTLVGVEGGAGTSLAAEQKRELQVRGVCRLRPDGLKEVSVQLLKPIGSVFRFLSDDSTFLGGQARAPSGLAYLSAGIAFCYLTQLGRYTHIVKKRLDGYRIVQDTRFSLPGASGASGTSGGTGKAGQAETVVTHVYLDTPEGDDFARTLVDMGEQTCFLHAACRSVVKTKIRCNRFAAPSQ